MSKKNLRTCQFKGEDYYFHMFFQAGNLEEGVDLYAVIEHDNGTLRHPFSSDIVFTNKEVKVNKDPKQGDEAYTIGFCNIWENYPSSKGKKAAFRCVKAKLNQGANVDELSKAALNYSKSCKLKGTTDGFIMHGSTFFGPDDHWKDWVNWEPDEQKPKKGNPGFDCDF